ncbi:hypothetical protein Q1695_007890 [Nippostrongylus brasiliensis]|nr:hypothetical protein Q1695_007890 [Nippostrongylus brasiliensis]
MGEFVENCLEGLLPTFEQLNHVQLFTECEVSAFIKRCRQFEYRLSKREKTPRDFLLYADYLCDFLKLLKCRRQRQNFWHKRKLIDGPLRKKVASIYRRAADRFQGNLQLWELLINFLNENTMRRELAAAYTRALQVHGKNEKLRRDFALWHFFSASSPQNARTQILGSLRLFPQSAMLYAAFFTIEINFVDKVLKRRKFITEEKGKRAEHDENDMDRVYDEEVDDSIMNLDVAKAVIEQALSAVPLNDASGMLVEMWKECQKVQEIPNIEKVRSFIVDNLNTFDNEDTRSFEIELASNGESKFDLFEEALKKTPTERMHRLYMQWLKESETKDAFVASKMREMGRAICRGGWSTDKDWQELEKAVEDAPDEYENDFIQECLEKRPKSAILWNVYLEKCVDDATMTSDEFRAVCNKALQSVDADEAYPIWKYAIDYSILHAPSETEQVFKDALKYANAMVASRIKILFVDYLNELFNEGKLSAENLRKRIVKLVDGKPNSAEFYCSLYKKEMARPEPDHKFAGLVIRTAVSEQDAASVEAVILYGMWALAHDPAQFHVVYQAGLKLFKGAELDEFMTSWTHMVQGVASDAIDEEDRCQKCDPTENKGDDRKENTDADKAPEAEAACLCGGGHTRKSTKTKKRERNTEKTDLDVPKKKMKSPKKRRMSKQSKLSSPEKVVSEV